MKRAGVGGRGHREETLVFGGSTSLVLLHALDDAVLNRQPGVGLGQHALAVLLSLAIGIGGIVAFPRLRPGLRAGLALVFGTLALVNGALHVAHIAAVEAAHSDLTGVVAVLAGVVLIGLGLAIPLRHRGEGAATRRGRWAYRLIAVIAGALIIYVFLFPVSLAVVHTHKHREAIGEPPSAAYESVSFEASDGLRLSPAGT